MEDVRTGEVILSCREAARRLRVTPRMVGSLRKAGHLRAVLLTPPGTDANRRIYGILAASVNEYLHELAMRPARPKPYTRDPEGRAAMYAQGYITLHDAGKMLGMTTEGAASHCKTGKLPLVVKKIRYTTREAVEELQQERIARDVLMLADLPPS